MWSAIYFILCVFTVIRILSKEIDITAIAALSFIYYTSSCLLGSTWITGGSSGYYFYSDISLVTYICVIVQLLIINIMPIVVKEKKNRFLVSTKKNDEKRVRQSSRPCAKIGPVEIIFMISAVSIIYTIFFEIGAGVFFSFTSKTEIIQQTGTMFQLGIWGVLISFAYSLQYRKKLMFSFSVFLLLLTLILGSRAYITTAVIIFVIYNLKGLRNGLKDNIKIIIALIVVAFFLLIYKDIYKYVRALDFEAVLSTLTSGDTYRNLLITDESRTTFSLYEYVIQSNFSLSFKDSLVRVLSAIPFLNNFVDTTLNIRFSTIAQNNIFNSSYGLGSSFWAETYAMGGIVLVLLITAVWIGLLKRYSSYLTPDNPSFCFISAFVAYISFYINRLDWVQVWGAFKSIFAWFIVYWIIKSIFRSIQSGRLNE